MHVTLEVCIDSVASAIAAEEGGLLKTVKKRTQKVKVFPIIRPRAGDFLYSEDEFQVMLSDIQELKSAGADGVVVGVLLADGTVDEERTRRLIEAARPLPVTFHRAFDMTRDLQEAFSTLLSLGIDRVLTSGACRSALENLPLLHDLAKMAHQSNAPTRLMVCGGVRSHNAAEMLKGVSGGDQQLVSCIEVHSSGGRQSQGSGMVYRNPVVTMGHPSLSHLEYDVLVVSREEVGVTSIACLPSCPNLHSIVIDSCPRLHVVGALARCPAFESGRVRLANGTPRAMRQYEDMTENKE